MAMVTHLILPEQSAKHGNRPHEAEMCLNNSYKISRIRVEVTVFYVYAVFCTHRTVTCTIPTVLPVPWKW
jgi:hypothetical protein